MTEGSISLEYADKREFMCVVHGEFEGRAFRVIGTKAATWHDPACPKCTQARQQQEAEARRKQAEEQAAARAARGAILAGIPQRFRSIALEDYAVANEGQRRALTVLTRYAERFEERRSVGGGLILIGLPGTGKTHLMCGLARKLLDRWSVRYVDCWTMIMEIKATFKRSSSETEEAVIRRYTDPDLLLLDEIGVQYGTDAERAIIHRVIDLRYQAVKPTVVAGNLDLEGMAQYLGERAVSRLHENGGMVLNFDWADHRKRLPA